MKARIFIVGVGRSGTSLLQAMLGSHSDIEFLPETGFLRRYVFNREHSESIQTFWNAVKDDPRVARLNPDWSNIAAKRESESLALDVYEHLTSTDATFTGDKDPRLIESVECLIHTWKDCRVIHLYRDPRDVLASKKKAAWSKSRSLMFHLVAGTAQYSLACQTANNSCPRIMMVKYEDLSSNAEAKLRAICSWLDVSYDKQMLDFGSTAKRLTSESEVSWKKETFGPMLTSNYGKWKHSLTDFETQAVEVACAKLMKEGQYQKSNLPISFITKILATLTGLAAKCVAWVYVLKVKRINQKFIKRSK